MSISNKPLPRPVLEPLNEEQQRDSDRFDVLQDRMLDMTASDTERAEFFAAIKKRLGYIPKEMNKNGTFTLSEKMEYL